VKAHRNSSNQAIYDRIVSGTLEDKAFGCIMGAFVGDACGVYIDKDARKNIMSEETMEICMELPGGGEFNLGAG